VVPGNETIDQRRPLVGTYECNAGVPSRYETNVIIFL
jgi:hypothetical protein